MTGQFVCRLHGGDNPQAKANATKRVALVEIQRRAAQLVAFNADDQETPEAGLLREVLWSGQVARALGEACEALEDWQLSHVGPSGERLNPLLQAWSEERIQHARLCKMALDAGIEQRQIDILETQAGRIVAAMLSLLQSPRLGLSAETIIEGRVVAAEILRTMPRD
jgi:hypothetical protein